MKKEKTRILKHSGQVSVVEIKLGIVTSTAPKPPQRVQHG